ncbi:hypothetical protein C8R46DRAFT_1092825 [Mycena filopes]|nr:hypothetical protein C8R46DRAFT_1092825 [Mycena filopes]
MSSDEEYIPAADSHEPAFTSNGGSIFPNARHFTVAGGTFTITNITHYSVAPPAVQPGLRMIPREDIDPQQDLSVGRHSGVIRSRHEYERKCVRRVYSARLDSEGRTSAVTVTVYKGDGAEEEWRRDVANYVSKFATALDATRKRSEKLEKEKESTFSSSDHNLESPAARMAVAELAGQVLNQTYERVNDVMREQLGALQGTVNELMSQQQTPLQSQDGQRVAALTHENAKEKALNAQLKARIQDLEAAKHRTHASSGVNSTEALEKENKELKAMNQELMNRRPIPCFISSPLCRLLTGLLRYLNSKRKRLAELEKGLAASLRRRRRPRVSKRQLAPGEDVIATSKRRRGDDVEMQ